MDLLIIDANSCGTQLDRRSEQRRTPGQCHQAHDKAPASLIGADAALEKPPRLDKLLEFEWMGVIERVWVTGEQ
jgi:hypothetical protein